MITARAAALAILATGCLSKPSFECTFEVLPNSDMPGALLGTGGGGQSTVTDCGTRSFVGLEVAMTANTLPLSPFDQKVAVTSTMRCATVSTSGGAYSTAAIHDVPVPGGNQATEGPYSASCPDGQVALGLVAHVAEMLPDENHLLNSFALDCSAIDETGAPAGSPTRVPVLGTGTVSPQTEARCDAGYVLHGLESASGSQLDRLQIVCGRMICTPPR